MKSKYPLQVQLPEGMNDVDMQPDGSRSCFMYEHGGFVPNDNQQQALINNIMRAWGVVSWFDSDKHDNGKPGACNRDFSRHLMLQFPDGLWRQASFGGLSGEPMASCAWQGFPGRTGEEGYLSYKIFWQKRRVTNAMQKLEDERTILGQLETALGEAQRKR